MSQFKGEYFNEVSFKNMWSKASNMIFVNLIIND